MQQILASLRTKPYHLAVALFFVTCVVWSRTLYCDFVHFDDHVYIYENPQVLNGLTFENIRWAFTSTKYAGNWHPLTWLSLQLDASLFDKNAWGYHLDNVLQHAANTVLVFFVWRSLTQAVWRSVLVALLFSLHPLHVESVAWVTERKDTLSTFFWLATMWAYVAYLREPSRLRYANLHLLFLLGLLAKPMLVTLPAVLLLLDIWPLKRWQGFPGSLPWQLLKEKLGLFALVALSCMVTVSAQEKSISSTDQVAVNIRVCAAIWSYGAYLLNMVLPFSLSAMYPYWYLKVPVGQVLVSTLVLVGLTLLVLHQRRARPYLLIGWCWYLGTLVPVIGLMQVGIQLYADRYTYVPLLGIFTMLVWSAHEVYERSASTTRNIWLGLVGLVLLGCSLRTWDQIQYWERSEALWRRVVEITPGYAAGWNNLGGLHRRDALLEKAKPEGERQQKKVDESLAQSLACFDKAMACLLPKDFQIKSGILTNRGLVKEDYQIGSGKSDFLEAIRQPNPSTEAYKGLANLTMYSGDFKLAEEYFLQALKIQPAGDAKSFRLLGLCQLKMNKYAPAALHLEKALQLAPKFSEALRDLAWVQVKLAEQSGATESEQAEYRKKSKANYDQAKRLDPDWQKKQFPQAYEMTCHPQAENRDGETALYIAEQLCQATDFKQPDYLACLAAAHAEIGAQPSSAAGAFGEAVRWQQLALELASPADKPKHADRLALFQKRQPYRDSTLK